MIQRVAVLVVLGALGCTGADRPVAGDEFVSALTEVLATDDVIATRHALERATEAARGHRIRSRDCELVADLANDAVGYDETTADLIIGLYFTLEDCSAECREGLEPAYAGEWFAHSMIVRSNALVVLLERHSPQPRPLAEAAREDPASFVRADAYRWLFAHVTGPDYLRFALEANADPSAWVRDTAPVLAYPDAGVPDAGSGQ